MIPPPAIVAAAPPPRLPPIVAAGPPPPPPPLISSAQMLDTIYNKLKDKTHNEQTRRLITMLYNTLD